MSARSMDGVVLTAPVTAPYQRQSSVETVGLFGRVLRELLNQAQLSKRDLDGLAVSSFSLAPDTAVSLCETYRLSCRWLEQLPFGGASGVMAIKRAARAVQNGDARVVACIGADNAGGEAMRRLAGAFSRFSAEAAYPYGAAAPNSIFAMITRAYMETHGATAEDFGRLCISQRRNATANPLALLRKPLSMEDYLTARPIAEPLRLFDCVMPCAGAEGFLVMGEADARRAGLAFVRVLAAEERHNPASGGPIALTGGWADLRDDLYAAAGAGPGDVDLLQTYDDYPVIVFQQFEGLGFCAEGDGARFVRDTPLAVGDGGLPHNTGGGQLSMGQAGFAGGFLGTTETLRQLTGRATGAQVERPRRALVSGFGMVNYDRGLCSAAAILARGD